MREARRSAGPELGSRVERSDRASVVQAVEYSSSVGISVAQILGGVTLAVKVSPAALAVKAVSAGGAAAAGEAGEERESVGEAGTATGSRVELSDKASVVQALEYSFRVAIPVVRIARGATLAVKVSSAVGAVSVAQKRPEWLYEAPGSEHQCNPRRHKPSLPLYAQPKAIIAASASKAVWTSFSLKSLWN